MSVFRIGVAICLVAGLFVQGCRSAKGPASDHFDGRRFHNRAPVRDYTVWDEIKIAWQLRTKKKNWPARFETKPYRVPAEPLLHGIRVLWIGHSTTLIQTPALNIITDPILVDSIGPRLSRIETVTNPGVILESLPHIDFILISHNHYDHLDLPSLRALVARQRNDPPMILAGRGVGETLKAAGLTRYAELDWNEAVLAKDTRVFFLEAIHESRRGIRDRDKTLWGAYLIDSPEGRIYFAGDTAYGPHFRKVYETFGAPRVSLLPIGAYEPRWMMYRLHMNPDEAVRAHRDLHSRSSIGIHFGLIDNAGESYDAPVQDLVAARRAQGIGAADFVAPHYGQAFEY